MLTIKRVYYVTKNKETVVGAFLKPSSGRR